MSISALSSLEDQLRAALLRSVDMNCDGIIKNPDDQDQRFDYFHCAAISDVATRKNDNGQTIVDFKGQNGDYTFRPTSETKYGLYKIKTFSDCSGTHSRDELLIEVVIKNSLFMPGGFAVGNPIYPENYECLYENFCFEVYDKDTDQLIAGAKATLQCADESGGTISLFTDGNGRADFGLNADIGKLTCDDAKLIIEAEQYLATKVSVNELSHFAGLCEDNPADSEDWKCKRPMIPLMPAPNMEINTELDNVIPSIDFYTHDIRTTSDNLVLIATMRNLDMESALYLKIWSTKPGENPDFVYYNQELGNHAVDLSDLPQGRPFKINVSLSDLVQEQLEPGVYILEGFLTKKGSEHCAPFYNCYYSESVFDVLETNENEACVPLTDPWGNTADLNLSNERYNIVSFGSQLQQDAALVMLYGDPIYSLCRVEPYLEYCKAGLLQVFSTKPPIEHNISEEEAFELVNNYKSDLSCPEINRVFLAPLIEGQSFLGGVGGFLSITTELLSFDYLTEEMQKNMCEEKEYNEFICGMLIAMPPKDAPIHEFGHAMGLLADSDPCPPCVGKDSIYIYDPLTYASQETSPFFNNLTYSRYFSPLFDAKNDCYLTKDFFGWILQCDTSKEVLADCNGNAPWVDDPDWNRPDLESSFLYYSPECISGYNHATNLFTLRDFMTYGENAEKVAEEWFANANPGESVSFYNLISTKIICKELIALTGQNLGLCKKLDLK